MARVSNPFHNSDIQARHYHEPYFERREMNASAEWYGK